MLSLHATTDPLYRNVQKVAVPEEMTACKEVYGQYNWASAIAEAKQAIAKANNAIQACKLEILSKTSLCSSYETDLANAEKDYEIYLEEYQMELKKFQSIKSLFNSRKALKRKEEKEMQEYYRELENSKVGKSIGFGGNPPRYEHKYLFWGDSSLRIREIERALNDQLDTHGHIGYNSERIQKLRSSIDGFRGTITDSNQRIAELETFLAQGEQKIAEDIYKQKLL